MVATAAGVPQQRVDEVLEEVGLADVAGRRVGGFSVGMRQRLGLAAAMVGEPEVLILDEPANGLDPEGVSWLRRRLRSFADRGGTVLISSHLLAEVAQTVDDVLVIARGRLVTHSSLADLTSGATPAVRVLTPQPTVLRDVLTAKGMTAEVRPDGLVVVVDAPAEDVGLAAAGHGIVIYSMTTERMDLEETFLALTTDTHGARR